MGAAVGPEVDGFGEGASLGIEVVGFADGVEEAGASVKEGEDVGAPVGPPVVGRGLPRHQVPSFPVPETQQDREHQQVESTSESGDTV